MKKIITFVLICTLSLSTIGPYEKNQKNILQKSTTLSPSLLVPSESIPTLSAASQLFPAPVDRARHAMQEVLARVDKIIYAEHLYKNTWWDIFTDRYNWLIQGALGLVIGWCVAKGWLTQETAGKISEWIPLLCALAGTISGMIRDYRIAQFKKKNRDEIEQILKDMVALPYQALSFAKITDLSIAIKHVSALMKENPAAIEQMFSDALLSDFFQKTHYVKQLLSMLKCTYPRIYQKYRIQIEDFMIQTNEVYQSFLVSMTRHATEGDFLSAQHSPFSPTTTLPHKPLVELSREETEKLSSVLAQFSDSSGCSYADKYEGKAFLGRGASSFVFLVSVKHSGSAPALPEYRVIKIISLAATNDAWIDQTLSEIGHIDTSFEPKRKIPLEEARIREEIHALQTLRHEGIIQLYGYASCIQTYPSQTAGYILRTSAELRKDTYYVLVTEHFSCLTLKDIERMIADLALEDKLYILYKIAAALEYMHTHSLIHRDIKPDNILIGTQSGHFAVKVIDFGLIKIIQTGIDQTQMSIIAGTPKYMAPEIIQGKEKRVSAKADMYSLGITAEEFLGIETVSVTSSWNPSKQGPLSDLAETLIRPLLEQTPDKRPAAQEYKQACVSALLKLIEMRLMTSTNFSERKTLLAHLVNLAREGIALPDSLTGWLLDYFLCLMAQQSHTQEEILICQILISLLIANPQGLTPKIEAFLAHTNASGLLDPYLGELAGKIAPESLIRHLRMYLFSYSPHEQASALTLLQTVLSSCQQLPQEYEHALMWWHQGRPQIAATLCIRIESLSLRRQCLSSILKESELHKEVFIPAYLAQNLDIGLQDILCIVRTLPKERRAVFSATFLPYIPSQRIFQKKTRSLLIKTYGKKILQDRGIIKLRTSFIAWIFRVGIQAIRGVILVGTRVMIAIWHAVASSIRNIGRVICVVVRVAIFFPLHWIRGQWGTGLSHKRYYYVSAVVIGLVLFVTAILVHVRNAEIAYLINNLRHPNINIRTYAVQSLGKRWLTQNELLQIEKLLRVRDENTRAGACQVLGELKDPRSVSLLIKTLKDIRLQAAFVFQDSNAEEKFSWAAGKAIGKIGVTSEQLNEIRAMLILESGIAQEGACLALGELRDRESATLLIGLLKKGEGPIGKAAAEALGIIGVNHAQLEEIRAMLVSQDQFVREGACLVIGELRDGESLPILISMLYSRDIFCHSASLLAAEAIGKIGLPMQELQKVREMLTSDEGYLRARACVTLGVLKDRDSFLALTAALQDKDDDVRKRAAEALGKIKDSYAVPFLIIALKDTNRSVGLRAADALGKIGVNMQQLKQIRTMINTHRSYPRAGIFRALGELHDTEAVPALMEALREVDMSFCLRHFEPFEALLKIGVSEKQLEKQLSLLKLPNAYDYLDDQEIELLTEFGDRSVVIPAFIMALKNKEAGFRETIALELSIMGVDENQRKEIRAMLQSDDENARAGACTALGILGDRESIPALREKLQDKSNLVRTAAQQAIDLIEKVIPHETERKSKSHERGKEGNKPVDVWSMTYKRRNMRKAV